MVQLHLQVSLSLLWWEWNLVRDLHKFLKDHKSVMHSSGWHHIWQHPEHTQKVCIQPLADLQEELCLVSGISTLEEH